MLVVLNAAAASSREISGTADDRDADKIVFAGTAVRLNGIDAPENSNQYGRDATAFMERLLCGENVKCLLNGDRT